MPRPCQTMKVHTTRIHIHTYDGVSIQDIGAELGAYIHGSGVESGLCVISTSHAECALSLSDEVDERYTDLLQVTRQLLVTPNKSASPRDDRVDEVAMGATLAAFSAHSITLPVRSGELALGSWEAVLLLESRGPSSRQLDVTVLGD